MFYRTVPNEICRIMRDWELSLRDAAKSLGVKATRLKKWATKPCVIYDETAAKLIRLFGDSVVVESERRAYFKKKESKS